MVKYVKNIYSCLTYTRHTPLTFYAYYWMTQLMEFCHPHDTLLFRRQHALPEIRELFDDLYSFEFLGQPLYITILHFYTKVHAGVEQVDSIHLSQKLNLNTFWCRRVMFLIKIQLFSCFTQIRYILSSKIVRRDAVFV